MRFERSLAALSLSAALTAGCTSAEPLSAPLLPGLDEAEARLAARGAVVFDTAYTPAQGLGPLYIRSSCGACHDNAGRGPGTVTRMVRVRADGVTPHEDQRGLLPWGSVARPSFTAGATRGVEPPSPLSSELLVSLRVGPALYGRGLLEAVDEAEVERVARAQREGDGPERGVVPRLADGRLGRFGLKARLATLDEFSADAFAGDLGLTSPTHPTEPPNPDGLVDDARPGVDLDAETVREVSAFVRALAIPERGPDDAAGEALFARARCAVCHTPSLRTRADAPWPSLRGRDATLYSDLLLHDLGDALADGVVEGAAGPRHFRTAPLVGLRFARSFLHDGRARSLDDAITRHRGPGSEANLAVERFEALVPAERAALLAFVASR